MLWSIPMPIRTKELYFSYLERQACFLYLFKRIEVDEVTECFNWTRGKRNGYGVGTFHGRHTGAHRLMLACVYGSVPQCFDIDHLCRNPSCCNPSHLEIVDHKTNINRARGEARPLCKYGHARKRLPSGRWICNTCLNQYMGEWRNANRDRMNEISRASYARIGRKDRRKVA